MNKNVMIAVLVFAGLLVAVMVMRAKPTKVGVKELKIEAIARDKVAKIEVTLPPKKQPPLAPDAGPPPEAPKVQHVVIERQGASFLVYDADKPTAKFPADEQSIDIALDALEELKVGDLIANKADKLAEYELDDERGLRTRITTTGGEALDLMFGRAAKGGGSTVRMAGSNDIFVAKGRFGPSIKKDVSQWRKKAIVGSKPDELTALTVKPAVGLGFTVTASTPAPTEPADGGAAAEPKPEWKITEPATLPAGFRVDASQVARVASAFTGVRAADYSEAATDDVTGLAGPHTTIEATTKDGKKLVLHLGKEDDKKRTYARVDGDPQLYLVSQFAAKQAARSLDDLRDMALVDAKVEDVERVTFKGSEGSFVVARDGDAWKLVDPKKPPENFDVGQIAPAVQNALRLRATRLAPSDAVATGVDKPLPFVELELKGGKKLAVRFGAGLPLDPNDAPPALPTDKPEPREFYVKGSIDELTYVVAASGRKKYDRPIDLFKKPPSHSGPPGGMGGGPGGGLDSLPPEMRKKLEEALKNAPKQ
jgi:Domain of unknown function (DUF4340)